MQNFNKGDIKQIQRSPLAKELFSIEGVKNVFFGSDFVTVTKSTNVNWHLLKNTIFSKILDFYAEDGPLILDKADVSDTTILDTDDEIVATIKELLETRIRPAVHDDGGDIFYEGFDHATGIVKVDL